MSKGAFRQADLERIIRAAKTQGAAVSIDLRTLMVTIIPNVHRIEVTEPEQTRERILPPLRLAPDGKDVFQLDEEERNERR